MNSFFQAGSSKDEVNNEDIDEDYHFYEEDALRFLKENQETNNDFINKPFHDLNKQPKTTMYTDVKPFSYYLKLYNKKQMFELDNPTFLSNQYLKQKKIAAKIAKGNKTSEKYKASIFNKKLNEEEIKKLDEKTKNKNLSDQSDQFNLKNLNQQLIQEHKKVFSYNQYHQNTTTSTTNNSFKHFTVNKNNNNINNIETNSENLDENIEIDFISDLKNNFSDKTEDNQSSTINSQSNENNINNVLRPKSSSKPANKLIKNIKQKFNFKKNKIDIKLPTAILEDELPKTPLTPSNSIAPNTSRLSTLGEIKIKNNASLITIESKKSTLHQQPFLILDKNVLIDETKIKQDSDVVNQKLPPPPPNREMLTRIYNACNRKLKKPKLKVKPISEDNLELENNQINDSVKINKSSTNNNSKYKLELEYRNSDEKNLKPPPYANQNSETKLRRAKFNENLKIESVSSFSSVNYSLLNNKQQNADNEVRQSYHLKANNIRLNPAASAKVDDPIKENIRNYRTRLNDINQNLNNLNNQFYVKEFIDEISKKNTSEPDVITEFNQFRQLKKDKLKNYTSSEFNLASTKSISVIDLSDLNNNTNNNEQDQQKRIPFFSAFRPMRLNEYIKNAKTKPTKTLASLVIDKQQQHQQHQKSVGSVAKKAIEAANNKFSNPVLSDSFIKAASSNSTMQDHPTEYYRKDFSITNESVNSSRFLETIVSKKRVSFHEQVLETDVVSGNSTFKPIVNYKYKNY